MGSGTGFGAFVATGRPTIKCWTMARVGVSVGVKPLRVGVAALFRVGIGVRVAVGGGVKVDVGNGLAVKVAVGVDVSVGIGVAVRVDVGEANATRRIAGAAIRLKTIAPNRHPSTTPTTMAIISCRRGCNKVTSGDYNTSNPNSQKTFG